MKATTLLYSLLSSLVLCAAQTTYYKPDGDNHKSDGETYDFVVVGAGPGGCPLASRLARAGHSVLLIDAGDDEGDRLTQQIPGLQGQATEDENYRWDYYVEMYDDAEKWKKNSRASYRGPDGTLHTGPNPPANSEDLGLLYPRSGTLGGCAAHNAMILLYPWERDWKYMQQLTGNYSSWDPVRMRGYFEKVENAQYVPNSVVGHGFSGWLHVSLTALDIVVEDIKLLGTVLGAVRAAGNSLPDFGLGRLLGGLLSIPERVVTLSRLLLTDMNSPDPGRDTRLGVWQVPIAVDPVNSHRATPRQFVLDTAKSYPLTLRLNTLVTKIIFDKSGSRPRVIGVDYLQGKSLYAADPRYKKTNEGKPGRVYARHEVIISTGTYSTPQLLKLSGIGPKQELDRWGIPVVHDLPGVGENLQDRYEGVVISQSTSNYSIIEKCTFLRTGTQDPCYQEWKNGVTPYTKGVYGSNGLALGITYRSSVSDGPEPDLFMSGVPVSFKGYYPDWATEGTQLSHFWSWYMLKARTANRAGSVTLRSTDPQDTPRISFRTLGRDTLGDKGDQDDLQAMYEGFLHMRKMVDDFVPLDGSSFTEVFPGRKVQSEKDIKEHLMNEAWGHHCGGTAAIGADHDRMAVLDSDHRVRGVDGLRVVDASTYSRIPGFFIVSWVYIISERAADIIIHEYK